MVRGFGSFKEWFKGLKAIGLVNITKAERLELLINCYLQKHIERRTRNIS